MFTAQMLSDLAAGAPQVNVAKSISDFKQHMLRWLQQGWNSTSLPPHTVGNVVDISRRLQESYRKDTALR